MKKIFYNILPITLILFLSGCGGGGGGGGGSAPVCGGGGGGGGHPPLPHSYPGPASCLTNSSNLFSQASSANGQSLPPVQIPFSVATALELKHTPPNPYHVNIGIVGGVQVTGSSSPSTIYPAYSNTVGIDLPVGSNRYLCSGVLVAVSANESLIVTAGHCFDYVDSTSTSPGYAIFSDAVNLSNPVSSGGVPISCWQRNSNYLSCQDSSTAQCVLNDIAWVKVAVNVSASPYNYTTVPILADPTTITAAEIKTMAGFGELGDSDPQDPNDNKKYMVDTKGMVQGGSGEPQIQDCAPPNNGVCAFDSQTFSGAYENYLTVIGPYYLHGTCEGDSGGPVYVNRSGAALAALTQGTNNILTPQPTNGTSSSPTTCSGYTYNTSAYANCNSGFGVYTTVGNYVSWLQSTSGATCNGTPSVTPITYSCSL